MAVTWPQGSGSAPASRASASIGAALESRALRWGEGSCVVEQDATPPTSRTSCDTVEQVAVLAGRAAAPSSAGVVCACEQKEGDWVASEREKE